MLSIEEPSEWQRMTDELFTAAQETVQQRGAAYGSPWSHHSATAQAWSAYLGHRIQPEQVSMLFILDKVIRSRVQDKADNVVDIAGYAWVHASVMSTKELISHLVGGDEA